MRFLIINTFSQGTINSLITGTFLLINGIILTKFVQFLTIFLVIMTKFGNFFLLSGYPD